MVAIAAFASSAQGQAYSIACQRFGVDPAAGFADDVVAANLRGALLSVEADRAPKDEPASEATDLERQWIDAAQ